MADVPELFPRSWIEFNDPGEEDQIIRADLTWLTSKYHCIYGQGCRSIDKTIPYGGCCTHGAHFADKADRKRVAQSVAQLTEEEWERKPSTRQTRKKDWTETDDDGERKTKVVDGACVEGDIRAPLVLVNGRVEGDVYGSRQVELAPKACVEGDVYYAMVEMAAGAEVSGSLTHVPAEALARQVQAAFDGA